MLLLQDDNPDPTSPPLTRTPVPRIDFAKLSFPTDAITVRDIRVRDAALFEGIDRGSGGSIDGIAALEAMTVELDVAQYAFDRACGTRGLYHGELTRDDLAGDLSRLYSQLGIGDGERSRLELVRQIEADAAAQAKAALGRGK